MKYGICHLSVIPIRAEANHYSVQQSQLLYGELFKVLEHRKQYSKIRSIYDGFEGWIDKLHYKEITQELFDELKERPSSFNYDLAHYVQIDNKSLMPVVIGALLSNATSLNHTTEISKIPEQHSIVHTAMMFLNSPSIQGGRSPFGIDNGGLSQMAYKLNGFTLKRTAKEQSLQGEPLSFIEEAKAGDLAFFDNKEGVIDHVGILLENNYIIHAYGAVRIDRIDHTGIFNLETNTYTHSLRVIKSLI